MLDEAVATPIRKTQHTLSGPPKILMPVLSLSQGNVVTVTHLPELRSRVPDRLAFVHDNVGNSGNGKLVIP